MSLKEKNKVMKNKILTIFLTSFFFILSLATIAATEPGDPGNDPQAGDPPLGGGAPIGSGLSILIGLGAAYGGYKLKYNDSEENIETK
jgi:hypothetical protein